MSKLIHKQLTDAVIRCFFKVYNTLGFGFLERVYENALMIELTETGMKAVRQKPIKVYFNNVVVGDYFADVVVEDSLIVEIKAVDFILDEH
jgi:GxxExxY protein